MNQPQTENYLSRIDREYPVRNSAEQKQVFRAWALGEARQNGFAQAKAVHADGHENLIFGRPDTARVIFTAHYDTPRRALLPNLMLVTNRVLFWAYHLGTVLAMLGVSLGTAFAGAGQQEEPQRQHLRYGRRDGAHAPERGKGRDGLYPF